MEESVELSLNYAKRVMYTRLLGIVSDSVSIVGGVVEADRKDYLNHIKSLTKQFAGVLLAMDE